MGVGRTNINATSGTAEPITVTKYLKQSNLVKGDGEIVYVFTDLVKQYKYCQVTIQTNYPDSYIIASECSFSPLSVKSIDSQAITDNNTILNVNLRLDEDTYNSITSLHVKNDGTLIFLTVNNYDKPVRLKSHGGDIAIKFYFY